MTGLLAIPEILRDGLALIVGLLTVIYFQLLAITFLVWNRRR